MRLMEQKQMEISYVDFGGNKVTGLNPHELVREDGRIERLCKHGVGHPLGHLKETKEWMGVHGCDDCCSKAEFWLQPKEENHEEA